MKISQYKRTTFGTGARTIISINDAKAMSLTEGVNSRLVASRIKRAETDPTPNAGAWSSSVASYEPMRPGKVDVIGVASPCNDW